MNEEKYPRVLAANTIGAAGCATESQSEVAGQLEALGEELACLHATITTLERRLEPVLRAIPVSGETPTKCRDSMCPIADAVHGHRCGVDSASTRIVHILDRLGI